MRSFINHSMRLKNRREAVRKSYSVGEITDACMKAEEKFWEEIVKQFPEIKTGDLAPEADQYFKDAMVNVVTEWIELNNG